MNQKFLIIAAGWNCEKYIAAFAKGIKEQTYKNFILVIVNDASTDSTSEQIDKHFLNSGIDCHVITQLVNGGGYNSFTTGMNYAKQLEYDVCAWVTLDDRIFPNGLERVNEEYKKGVYMTYGTYINKSGFIFRDLFYPEEIHAARAYRHSKFRPTAIRSFRRELYEAIIPVEQCDAERKLYYDLEVAFQLLEMCGKDKIGVITEPIYEYNNLRPESCANLHGRNMEVYNKICSRPKRDLIEL